MFRYLITVFCLLPAVAAAINLEKTLGEKNTYELLLAPYKATRIVFPYKIDSPFIDPRFTFTNTAPSIFATNTIEQIAGQDVFVITTLLNPVDALAFSKHEASIAMSFDGYYITLKLKTTTNTLKHIDNLFLSLPEVDRRTLINKEIDREKQRLQEEEKKRLARQNTYIKEQAFLLFAENGHKGKQVSLYFEKEDFTIGSVVLDFYIDNKVVYEDAGIQTYMLTIKNQSSKAITFSGFLLILNENENITTTSCNKVVLGDTEIVCSFAKRDTGNADKFELQGNSDSGNFSVVLGD